MNHTWTFLTNHGHVLLALYRNGNLRQREIARLVGITEGAVHRILSELDEGGYIEVERIGRRNHYRVNLALGLRHPVEAGHSVGELLKSLAPMAGDFHIAGEDVDGVNGESVDRPKARAGQAA